MTSPAGPLERAQPAETVAEVPRYVADRIRRPAPSDCHVLAGSTPVVAFGNPRTSRVATLGLNPSRIEFEIDSGELDGPARRFETFRSLGVDTLQHASDALVERVYARCNNYFHGNPYGWFDQLEPVVQVLGASYFRDSACHLDLSQWATDPTWNGLEREERAKLVHDGSGFLAAQLHSEPIEVLLLNGRSVIDAVGRVLGLRLRPEEETVSDRTVTTRFHTGRFSGVAVIGWSTNLQSSRGVTNLLRTRIAERVRELWERLLVGSESAGHV